MNPGKRGHEGIKEAPLSWLQSLNQRQSDWRAGGSEGVLSYLIYISQFAVTSLFISQWVGQRPSSRFLFPFLFFFYVSLLQLPSQSRAKVSSLGFRLLWLPPVEAGFTHTHRQRHMVRARGGGCRRLSSCLSEWLCAEDVSAFLWTWGRGGGWRLFFLFLFYFIFFGRAGAGWGGGLEVTDMSRLPHWADPNRKIKVKRFTEHGNCWFLCLFVCTDTHIRNTLWLERGTEAHKKGSF